jgi:hypothetical protein
VAIGVGILIERTDGSQDDSAALVDHVKAAQVPSGIAHDHFAEVTIPCRNLEPHPFQRDRSIALALSPPGLQTKRIAKRLTRWAGAKHVGHLGELLDRRAGDLAVGDAVVLDFHPCLGRSIEEVERQLDDTVERLHQPPLEPAPKRLPGRPGGLTPQGSHRSGRAVFQHPVLHLTSSLRGSG